MKTTPLDQRARCLHCGYHDFGDAGPLCLRQMAKDHATKKQHDVRIELTTLYEGAPTARKRKEKKP